jgi:SAM-dependent methyltransferase
MTKREIEELIDSTMNEEFRHFDLRPQGDRVGPANDENPRYLLGHRHEYIRTIEDVLRFAGDLRSLRILEIGAFFGMVSICLTKLGFRVCAADIPEYMSMPEQKERFGRHGIEIAEVRLQDYVLPFADEAFDVIIMCEVLEHLNFNPLPLIKEINRVGAPGSLFYLSLPNLAYYRRRLQLLLGKPVLQPIGDFFNQLDPAGIVIVNGHWREYTGPEIVEMLQRMGYEIRRHYYFSIAETLEKPTLKNRLTRLVFRMIPSFKENQTTLAIRKKRCDLVFRIPRTVHESLETL